MDCDQARLGPSGIRRMADQMDHRIKIIEGHQQALEDVITLLRLAQQITGATLNGFNPEIEEYLEHPTQVEQHRL